jgi:hypothetical protein
MQVKINVDNLDLFKVACEATDVTIRDSRVYGKQLVVQVSFRNPEQLFRLGMTYGQLPSNEELANQITIAEESANQMGNDHALQSTAKNLEPTKETKETKEKTARKK